MQTPPTPPAPPDAPEGAGRYTMPIDAPVVDRFRPPATPYGPGNRGWELATSPGRAIGSVGAGVVTFAGFVARRGVVTVSHPDGLRSSLTGLATVDVRQGDAVARGGRVGTAGTTLHLGFRFGDTYVDPALLLGGGPVHAVLVPVPPGAGARGGGG